MNTTPRADSDADPSAISIEEALSLIKDRLVKASNSEQIACHQAFGRILAADIFSPISVPAFRASAMDGYALRVSEASQALRIESSSLAGHPGPDEIGQGCCQRITTGARVPDDADAVVQQENTERSGHTLSVLKDPSLGLNIRDPGSDSQQGVLLLKKGTLLSAAQLAVLAAHGIAEVSVWQKVKIAIFSTGDELITPPQALKPGQIYDANRPLLTALFQAPSVEIIDLGIASDTEQAIEQTFRNAADADIVISSGGVSVGEADHVRPVLERIGRVDLWKIAMKPGRPLTFGFSQKNQAYFGLPGNPVSAALTTMIFVKPSIRFMLGRSEQHWPPLHLPLNGELKKLPGRVEYQRAIMHADENGNWQVGTTGLQDSHVLTSLHHANCLVELPLSSAGATSGELVKVIPFTYFSDGVL